METWEIVVVCFLIVLFCFSLMAILNTYFVKTRISSIPITRGMNGMAGETLKLSCPVGTAIKFLDNNKHHYQVALFISGDSNCDAFWRPEGQIDNLYNPKNTFNVLTEFPDLRSTCENKNSCTWTIPTKSDSKVYNHHCIGASPGALQLSGTYNCE